jgi:O-antigen/teichoic acid export membrane protein
VFIFVKNENDLWVYALIMGLSTLVAQSVVWLFIRRFVKFIKPAWSEMKIHIKPILVLFIPLIAFSIYNTLDKIILGIMTDKVQLGFYESSQKIIFISIGFISAANVVIVSRMSNITAKGDENEKKRLMLSSMKYIMLVVFAMTFGIAAIADKFAPLYFGNEFRDCGILIVGLCISVPFFAFSNSIASYYLIPNFKDKTYTIATVSGAVVNVISNIILIPVFEAMGAVISTIFAESVRCIIMTIVSAKALPIMVFIKNSVFFFFAGIIMFLLIRLIDGYMSFSVKSILIQIFIGATFYLGSCAVYLYKTKDVSFINGIKTIKNRR